MTSWKKIITSGSSAELSSLIIENVPSASTGQSVLTYDINSGRIYKTGSYGGADATATASLALSGGSTTNPFFVNNDCFISGGLTVSGNFSPAGGVTITDTSVDNFTSNTTFQGDVSIAGVTKLGTSSANTVNHEITGNLVLSASEGITVNVTTQPGFIGTSSHALTSSYASESISSSYALTASHAANASLPLNPTFTTLTTTATTNLAGPLTVENGSTFNSGVTINGDLAANNILTINNSKLKISASNNEVNFVSETRTTTQADDETIFRFSPSKPSSAEKRDTFIEISSSKDNSRGLRFIGNKDGSANIATIISDKGGIITISGSGPTPGGIKSLAGSIIFRGRQITLSQDTVIKSEGVNNLGFSTPIQINSPVTIAGSLTALASTLTGTISCGGIINLGTTQLTNQLTMGGGGQPTQLSISNAGKITTSGSIKTFDNFIGDLTGDVTGDLTGTSSFATSASHAYLSFFSSHSFNSATAFSASYASSSTSASFAHQSPSAVTASYAHNLSTVATASHALTASHLNTSVLSASHADNASSASYASSSTSASYALSSTSADESQKIRFNNDTQLLNLEFYIPYADNNSGQKSLFANTDFRFNPNVNSLSTTSSHAVTASHAITSSFALNAEGGGLWFDGTTYWTSSIQPSGTPTKIGIGREPTLYSLEVNGTMAATQDVIAFMGSDKRLKDNIKLIENPIDKIKQIGGYTFDWNNNQNVYQGSDVGVIAQEIEKVLPSLVQTRDDGYKGVKYDKIVALLIEAIKDQQKQIDELKKLI